MHVQLRGMTERGNPKRSLTAVIHSSLAMEVDFGFGVALRNPADSGHLVLSLLALSYWLQGVEWNPLLVFSSIRSDNFFWSCGPASRMSSETVNLSRVMELLN